MMIFPRPHALLSLPMTMHCIPTTIQPCPITMSPSPRRTASLNAYTRPVYSRRSGSPTPCMVPASITRQPTLGVYMRSSKTARIPSSKGGLSVNVGEKTPDECARARIPAALRASTHLCMLSDGTSIRPASPRVDTPPRCSSSGHARPFEPRPCMHTAARDVDIYITERAWGFNLVGGRVCMKVSRRQGGDGGRGT